MGVWDAVERALHLDGEEMVHPEGCRGFPSGNEFHLLSAACNSM